MIEQKPYFEDEAVKLYKLNFFDVSESIPNDFFDCVITDPPYTEDVHANAKSNASSNIEMDAISFSALHSADLDKAFCELGRVTKGWVISTLAYQQAFRLSAETPETLDLKRLGVWVKTTYAPQVLGDRPAQAWEAIAYFYKKGLVSKWNGGGKHGNYVGDIAQPNGHPTAKPIGLLNNFVELFTNPNDVIFDPFAGSGTTLLAARNLGRKAIGFEIDERYCELTASRLEQQAFDFGGI